MKRAKVIFGRRMPLRERFRRGCRLVLITQSYVNLRATSNEPKYFIEPIAVIGV